jgi:hypothetical protein
MLKKTTILIFGLLSFVVAFAQQQTQQSQSEQTQEEQVEVTVKIYRWAFSNKMVIPDMHGSGGKTQTVKVDQGDIDLHYKVGSDYRPLRINSGTMSPAFEYKGPRTMVFYNKVKRVSLEGEEAKEEFTYEEVAKMIIPLNVEQIFALMFKMGKKVRFYPMNVSPKQLPKERIAVLNMTSTNAAILVGGDARVLRPGANAIYKPKSKKETSVKLQIARRINNKWTPVYNNNISTPKDQRCVILLFDPYNKKTPRFSVQLLTL